ncbi:hypothetical protein CEXT_300401 [Caerostris extrusa]|uniref:Uncharacterized protein n=1 Tax=Caerostris extrusa TaxID=172846 RepID=A0AAV4NY21_CAEEX|nr:hypothetical protein CEXT_300401 [Caerostris extrusa]
MVNQFNEGKIAPSFECLWKKTEHFLFSILTVNDRRIFATKSFLKKPPVNSQPVSTRTRYNISGQRCIFRVKLKQVDEFPSRLNTLSQPQFSKFETVKK